MPSLIPTSQLDTIEYNITHRMINYEYVIFNTNNYSEALKLFDTYVKNAKEHKLTIYYKLVKVTREVLKSDCGG